MPTHALNQQQIATIKATIPLLESGGVAITEHFYKRLFLHNPELQHIFNMGNQHSGKQQFALFNALAAYAKYIDDLPAISSAVKKITNKHASLNIQPEHYPIVGHHLIETLRELVPDAFTVEVEQAWVAAYTLLSNIFIDAEEAIYKTSEAKDNGWRGAKKFRLTEKHVESQLVTSLVFTPTDGSSVIDYKPGQYIGIKVSIKNHEFSEMRQYSLSDKPHEDSYRISVKRETAEKPGTVSNFLHDTLQLGDEVELLPPAGDFFFQDRQAPVVLISAGVGITPMQSIIETLAENNYPQDIYFLHAAESSEQHSFKERLSPLADSVNLVHHTWYRKTNTKDNAIHSGLMDIPMLEKSLPISNGDFYLCGPVAFMRFIKQQLTSLSVEPSRIHYEVFGPHEAF